MIYWHRESDWIELPPSTLWIKDQNLWCISRQRVGYIIIDRLCLLRNWPQRVSNSDMMRTFKLLPVHKWWYNLITAIIQYSGVCASILKSYVRTRSMHGCRKNLTVIVEIFTSINSKSDSSSWIPSLFVFVLAVRPVTWIFPLNFEKKLCICSDQRDELCTY